MDRHRIPAWTRAVAPVGATPVRRARVAAVLPAAAVLVVLALPAPLRAEGPDDAPDQAPVVDDAAGSLAGAIDATGTGAPAPSVAPAAARAVPARIPDATEPTGRVTGYALPRFVTLKRDRARARRGPGEQWRVDWEFVARGMPLEVVAEYGNWRRVRDIEGHGGWVHHIFLDGSRSAIVTTDMAALRARADPGGPERARMEAGAILKVDRCRAGWCEVEGGGARGWTEAASLWGVRPDEAFD